MTCKLTVSTPHGFSMPALGFGTWQSNDEELEAAMEAAFSTGYRHFDTAFVYQNEKVLGKVIKKWLDDGKVTRNELFIVTKLPCIGNRPEEVEFYLKTSLESLQLSYVDMYLIHLPFTCKMTSENLTEWEVDNSTDLAAVWKEMEKQVDEGRTKAIGVSNFNNKQVERILKIARIPPSTNQVELHLYLQQPELIEFQKKNGVTVTAYSPLGTQGTKDFFNSKGVRIEVPRILDNPTVLDIAKKHDKTPAQVLLRHLLQKGVAVIPKSTNPKRIKENFQVFDFELDSQDVEDLNKENINHRILDFKFFKNVEDHPEYPF